jgi:hypothetical protein
MLPCIKKSYFVKFWGSYCNTIELIHNRKYPNSSERRLALDELSLPLLKELTKLVDDYFRCNDEKIKDQIRSDIVLLSKAIMLSDLP